MRGTRERAPFFLFRRIASYPTQLVPLREPILKKNPRITEVFLLSVLYKNRFLLILLGSLPAALHYAPSGTSRRVSRLASG